MMRNRFPGLLIPLLLMTGCKTPGPPLVSSEWVETQLFFGLTTDGGKRIPDAEWHDFVDQTITPRYPDGLTILYGDGQYRGHDGAVHKEPSAVLILIHPAGDDTKLTEIAREYDRRFRQESVLRADTPANMALISIPPSTSSSQ